MIILITNILTTGQNENDHKVVNNKLLMGRTQLSWDTMLVNNAEMQLINYMLQLVPSNMTNNLENIPCITIEKSAKKCDLYFPDCGHLFRI